MKKGFTTLEIVLLIIVFSGVVGGGAYYLGARSSNPKINVMPSKASNLPRSTPSQKQQTNEPLFSGKIKKLSNDLALFKMSEIDKENGVPESLVYYEAGEYLRGEYKGYKRVLAIRPAEGPGPSIQFILATKDYASYVLDDPDQKTVNYPIEDWDNPYMYLEKIKITQTATLDSDHPQTISVEKPFKLMKQNSVLTEFKKTNTKDKNSNDIYLEEPISTFEKSLSVPSLQPQLSLYYGGTDWGTGEGYNAKEKADLATRKQYLSKTTTIHAVDSTGLTYSYILSTEKDVDAYLAALAANEQKNIEYKKQVVLYNDKKLKEYPTSPEYAAFPGLRLTKSSAGLASDFYTKYDAAFPGACGGAQSTFIVNSITEADLTPVTSTSVLPLFILKDTKNPLFELAYNTKTSQGEESFKVVNEGKSVPTLADFIAKHPLLFFKDAWGNWAVVGEFDWQLMGGCGKPVVYLYPTASTNIHLSFVSPVSLNTNIPTYTNGWYVQAEPNGALTDLQPQYTDCSKIDTTHEGSEYALQACKTNTYPYIYWSGKSVANSYPKAAGGWIVEKENLDSFLQEKLSQIGLNQKESHDMISYWAPQMKKKNTLYYRVSFLQTREMNTFVPMLVHPQPDSVLRVFLDWNGLNAKPTVTPEPQQLSRFERNGFTLVEWGGLK